MARRLPYREGDVIAVPLSTGGHALGVLARVLRRGDFTSVADLTKKILAYIAYYNAHFAHPYEWTYTGKPGASGDKRKRKRFRFRRRQLVDMRSP